MKILTVSVAAYNMEKLIRQNLDSFVNSSVAKDIEVLVINDGSKDSTAEIVTEYQEKYPETVKLINQENAGPGSTVNRGIENATGKYFRMVDSDDWVDRVGFETYVNALKEKDADMVLTDYTEVDNESGREFFRKTEGIEPGKVTDFESVCENLLVPMHAVTYRTSILKDNGIRLFNGFYTDMQYLIFPVPYVKTVFYADCNVYMYRISLAGQSMSAASMQRNLPMHDAVLWSVVDVYNKTKKERPKAAKFIQNRLIVLAGCQLGTLLSFEPDDKHRKMLFDFTEKLKSASPEVYEEFKKLKTVKLLSLGGGMFYSLASKLHRKKIGL